MTAGLMARICRWLFALVLLFAPAATVHASAGQPVGWRVQDATGHLTVGKIHLAYEPSLEDDARWLRERIPAWWADIERALSARDIDERLRITLVDHAGQVAEATGMPTWAAGVARPARGEVIVSRHGPDGSRTDLETLVKHEMAHVILHRVVDGKPVPRWLSEGVAESFTGGISLTRAETLAGAVFGPGVPAMDELDEAFRHERPDQVSVAYAAARDWVAFLRYHDDGKGARFRQALAEVRAGHTIEIAFIRAYGLALPELARQWRIGLPARFMWYALLGSGGLPFALVVPLVGWAWVRRRRVLQAGWDRLAREDLTTTHTPSPLAALAG